MPSLYTAQVGVGRVGFLAVGAGRTSLAPVQNINLAGYGFNRRQFGTPTITGITQALSVFVAGVDVSMYAQALTTQINRQLSTTGTAQLHFSMLTTDTYRPVVGDSLTISEFGKRIFSGYIAQANVTIYPGTRRLDYAIQAVDWTATMQRRIIIAAIKAGQLLAIVNAINAGPALTGEGFTVDIDPDIVTVTDFNFQYIKVGDAFNQLALDTDTIWWVDNYQVIHFATFDDLAASAFAVVDGGSKQVDPSDMSGTGGSASTFVNMKSLANYRNKQYVKASSNILSETVVLTESHTFTLTRHPDPINGPLGIDSVCPTTYPFGSQPDSVKENGVEIIGTPRFFEMFFDGTPTAFPPAGQTGYYWFVGGFGIWFWPTYENGPLGTTIEVTYTGTSAFQGNVVAYADTAEIVAMAAIMGTTGIFEEVEQYNGTATYAELLALAKGIEQATAPIPNQLTVSTVEHIEDIGLLVAVNLADFGIDESMAIQQISSVSLSNTDLGKGSTFRTTITLVSQKTLGDWRSWFERLLAKLQAVAIIPPQERLTWQLATDVPGALSEGLALGSFGAPLTVSSDQGQLAFLSVIFLTAADADITLDVLHVTIAVPGGASIFGPSGGGKPVYHVSDTGNVRYYLGFIPGPYNVAKGDQFILSVLTAGLVAPGKNGTAILVVDQQ